MIKKKSILILAIFVVSFFVFVSKTKAGTLGEFSQLGNIEQGVGSYDMIFDNNDVPYQIIKDLSCINKMSVLKYDGNNWVLVGDRCSVANSKNLSYFDESNNLNIFTFGSSIEQWTYVDGVFVKIKTDSLSSLTNATSYFSDAVFSEDGVPYFFALDNGDSKKAFVLKYNGSSWEVVTKTTMSIGETYKTKMAVGLNEDIYFSFGTINSLPLFVKKYDKATETWSDFDGTGLGSYFSSNYNIKTYNSQPYVVYSIGGPTLIKKYSEGSWVNVASNTPTNLLANSVSFNNNGELYLAYNYSSSGKTFFSVLKLNEGVWIYYAQSFSLDQGYQDIGLKFDSLNKAYLTHGNFGNKKLRVWEFLNSPKIYYENSLVESFSNNGELSGEVKVSLVNKNFVNSNGILEEGIHYTINNLPTGLTSSAAVSADGKSVVFTFLGQALYHGEDQDVSNLIISFLDAAFVGGGASSVQGASKNDLKIDFLSKPYAVAEYIETESIKAHVSGNSIFKVDSNNNIYLFRKESLNGTTTIEVKKYNGSAWSSVGQSFSFGSGNIIYLSAIGIDNNNVPYVVYEKINAGIPKLSVLRYNSGTSSWVFVGDPDFQTGANNIITSVNIDFDSNNNIYLTKNQDSVLNYRAFIMKFDGISWSDVGTRGSLIQTGSVKIKLDNNNVPYISFYENGNSRIKKFLEGSWVNVGEVNLSEGKSINIKELLIDTDNNPIVVYVVSDSQLIKVKKFNGNSWVSLGTNNVSDFYSNNISASLDANGIIYILFDDNGKGGMASMRRLVNNQWENVGFPGFSLSAVSSDLNLSFADNGPYFSYSGGSDYYLRLARLLLPPAITNLTVEPEETQALMSWSEAAESGGEIDSYLVKYKTLSSNSWSSFSDSSTDVVVKNLKSKTVYESEVSAVNVLGVHSEPLRTILETEVLTAPTNLSYDSLVNLVINEEIESISPTVSGNELLFSVSPELPAGLSLNSETGVISGTPTELSDEQVYEITVSNSGGSLTTSISLAIVLPNAPNGLSYQTPVSFYKDQVATELAPTISGSIDSFSISPSLPIGLLFDTTTGVISGTPTQEASSTVYTISATNEAGTESFELTISVVLTPPTDLSYITNSVNCLVNNRMPALEPTVVGEGISFSVSPNLPEGISIDSETGIISGTATEIVGSQVYTILATNSGGAISFELTMSSSEAAVAFTYENNKGYVIGEEIEPLVPTSSPEGAFFISYDLPAGLSIDQTTGVISGTPTNYEENTSTSTIIARTDAGQQVFDLVISTQYLPREVSYFSNNLLAINKPARVEPSDSQSDSVRYSINPELPEGLSIDVSTGVISGVPVEISSKKTYTIVASNLVGSTTTQINLSVVMPWKNITSDLAGKRVSLWSLVYDNNDVPHIVYSDNSRNIYIDKYENNSWSRAAYLNSGAGWLNKVGLYFDNENNIVVDYSENNQAFLKKYVNSSWEAIGSEDGIETYYQDLVIGDDNVPYLAFFDNNDYNLFVKKPIGEQTQQISNVDYSLAPSNLSYPNIVYANNQPINPLYPEIDGSVEYYEAQSLPSGLYLDSDTGVIYGTPQEVVENGVYTITAVNDAGSISFDWEVSVLEGLVSEAVIPNDVYDIKLLTDSNGIYYFAAQNNSNYNAVIYKVNSSNSWDLFAEIPNSDCAQLKDFKINNESLYLACEGSEYIEDETSYYLKLIKYDLEANVLFDTKKSIISIHQIYFKELLFDNQGAPLIPYYSYWDDVAGDTVYQSWIEKYNATTSSWEGLGSTLFEEQNIGDDWLLDIDSNNVFYLAYHQYDKVSGYKKIKTKSFSLVDGVWQAGTMSSIYTSLDKDTLYGLEVDNSNNVYLLYKTYNNEENYGFLSKYDGLGWSNLGNIPDYYGGLAVNDNSVPYVYLSSSGGEIIKYENNTWTSVGTNNGFGLFKPVFNENQQPVVLGYKQNDWSGNVFVFEQNSAPNVPSKNLNYQEAPTSLSYDGPVYYFPGSPIINLYPNVVGSIEYYEAASLPSGLSLDPNSGVIYGTPQTEQSGTYTITAANSAGSVSFDLEISVLGSWESLSEESISEGSDQVDLEKDANGNLYVAYSGENGQNWNYSLYVKKYDQDNQTWSQFGEAVSYIDEDVYNFKMIINEAGVYLAYFDEASYKFFVKKYDDGQWVTIGDEVVEASVGDFSFVIDEKGVPYISLEIDDYRVLTKTYINNSWQEIGSILEPAFSPKLLVSDDTVSLAYTNGFNRLYFNQISEFTGPVSHKEVSVIDENLINEGGVSALGGNGGGNPKALRFNRPVKFTPFSGASVEIPSGLVMSADETFDPSNLVAATADVSELRGVSLAGALKFGLPNLGLSLNVPITINIPVSGFSDGKVLKVYSRSAGSDWRELTTCIVSSNICSFQTTHLSDFAAGLETVNQPPASSGGGTAFVASCTAVTYGEFSSSCVGGYQYRNFLTMTPLNCSLTKEQREAGRRACGNSVVSNPDKPNSNEKPANDNYRIEFLAREKTLLKNISKKLTNKLLGKILLQVEEKGEAWYINPLNGARYFLGRPSDALEIMKKLALGITNKDSKKFLNSGAPSRLSGRILLDVEDSGKAYYVNPGNLKLQYLGRPEEAFQVMRSTGLGITNDNIRQLKIGEVN